MREYCFPYREEISESFGQIPRPAVEVFVKAQTGQWFRVFAYVDSGADFSLFPKGLCKLLGIELKAGQRSLIQGISGKPGVVYLHELEMRIGDTNFNVRVGFAASERMPYLLGGLDVLDHFDIRFEKHRACFIEREE